MDPNLAFELRVRVYRDAPTIIIRAYDNVRVNGRNGLDVEVRHGGRTIFPRGSFVIGLPFHASTDGAAAKAAVLGWLGSAGGFEGYTPDQIDWVHEYGEVLAAEAEARYGPR